SDGTVDLLRLLEPELPMLERLLGRAQAHVLALAEDLHARRIARRLVAEDEPFGIPASAFGRERLAFLGGIEGIAPGRHQHHRCGRELAGPVFLLLEDLEELAMFLVGARERM